VVGASHMAEDVKLRQKFALIFTTLNRHLISVADGPFVTPITSWMPRKISTDHIIKRDGRFFCAVCQKSYSRRSDCYQHLQSHSGATTCRICNTVLASKIILAMHMAKHLGTFQCDACNKIYSNKRELKKHKLKCC